VQSEAQPSSSVVVNSVDGGASTNPPGSLVHISPTLVSHLASIPSTTVPKIAPGSLRTAGGHRGTRERDTKHGARVQGDHVSMPIRSAVALATHLLSFAPATRWYGPTKRRSRFNEGPELAFKVHADGWVAAF
jgi:hypothetical protein